MKYSGGKSRSAKRIASIIAENRGTATCLVSPFMGGLSVELALVEKFPYMRLSDVVPDLVQMWNAVNQGWLPPESLTEDLYRELRGEPPSALRGFAGFGGSFGGKWFGGYGRISEEQARRNGGSRTCYEQVRRGLVGDQARLLLTRATISQMDYRDVAVGREDVVYADPPYAGTLGYAAAGVFDSEEFWDIARGWTKAGALVFVSEEQAPADWWPIWSAQVPGSMDRKDRVRTENVFVRG